MNETDYRVDKSTWGPGPWQDEPDRVDFVHAGFACLARRRESLGQWCGYVAVPREHPLYGKRYEDADGAVEFHGGLTYSQACAAPICHVPAPGMPDDVWWLGGDFAHCWDYAPGMAARLRQIGIRPAEDALMRNEVYRDLPYVRREIERLAEQLAAIGGAS